MTAGKPLDPAYTDENVDLVVKGSVNLQRHIENTLKYNVPVIVSVNSFATDTEAEIQAVKKAALDAGATAACVCTHHSEGGKCATLFHPIFKFTFFYLS